jgi:DNA-binding GntR family transcriptional regulator
VDSDLTSAPTTRPQRPRTTDGSAQTVVDYATGSIRHGILEGQYAPGQRLIEAELTQRLGVSRGPLREALRRLAADGLIDIEPYRGATVTRLSRVELADVFRVREVLEGLAARLAADRIGEGDNRRRAERVRAELLRPADLNTFLEDNDRFHQFVIELSGNGVVGRQVSQLQLPPMRAAFFRLINGEIHAQSVAQHRDILDAILAGDAARAEREMTDHVRRTAEISHKLPDQWFRG